MKSHKDPFNNERFVIQVLYYDWEFSSYDGFGRHDTIFERFISEQDACNVWRLEKLFIEMAYYLQNYRIADSVNTFNGESVTLVLIDKFVDAGGSDSETRFLELNAKPLVNAAKAKGWFIEAARRVEQQSALYAIRLENEAAEAGASAERPFSGLHNLAPF